MTAPGEGQWCQHYRCSVFGATQEVASPEQVIWGGFPSCITMILVVQVSG